MPARISFQKQKRILHLYFSGLSQKIIAKKLGVVQATVSNEVSMFKSLVKDSSLKEASKLYNLENVVEELRALSVELHKLNLSPKECLDFAKTFEKLKRLGGDTSDLEGLLMLCQRVKMEGIKAEDYFNHAVRLARLEADTGKDYKFILEDLERKSQQLEEVNAKLTSMKKEIKGLESRKAELATEIENLEKKLKEKHDEVKLTDEKIEIALRIDRLIAKTGESEENIYEFLKEIQKSGLDLKRIKMLYETYGSLEKAVSAKQEEYKKITRELSGAKQELERIKHEASQLKAEIEVAEKLMILGYDIPTLKLLAEGTKKYGGAKATLELLAKLGEHIDLDKQTELKRKELKHLQYEVSEKRVKFESLKKAVDEREKAKETLERSISALNVSLTTLTKTEKDLKLELPRLAAEKTKLEGELQSLKQNVEERRNQLSTLTEHVGDMRKEKENLEKMIRDLEERKSALEAEIKTQQEEIGLGKAISILLGAGATKEELIELKKHIEQIIDCTLREPPSKVTVEAAKSLIINQLMPRFAAFECQNCYTRFLIDSTKKIEDYFLDCPVCHSSRIKRVTRT